MSDCREPVLLYALDDMNTYNQLRPADLVSVLHLQTELDAKNISPDLLVNR